MPHASTSLMTDYIQAVPTDAACSQATQAAISTADIGTQCTIGFFNNVGSQTEAGISELKTANGQAGASFGGFPTSRDGPGQVVVEQQGSHCSSAHPCSVRKTATDRKNLWLGNQLCASELGQQHEHRTTTSTTQKEVPARMTAHTCDVCKKHFSRKHDLLRHMRTHTGHKPHTCSLCQKSFVQKGQLVRHKRSHTGEKGHVCSVCEKSYNRKEDLVVHQRTHTGEKPYVCSVCGRSYTSKRQLVIHERCHTGEKAYICGVCQKIYTRKGEFVIHERSHKGEKPYMCTVCEKSYSAKRTLAQHEKVCHTGEKPHMCSACKKCFVRKDCLVRHKRSHKNVGSTCQ